MPLNKQDLKSIKTIVDDSIDTKFDEKLEPFAVAIQNDIALLRKDLKNDIHKLKKDLIKRLMKVEEDISYLKGRTDLIERKLEELREELRDKLDKDKINEIEKQVINLEKRISKLE